MQREQGGRGFERSRRAERMSVHGLRRTHGELGRMLPEYLMNRGGLGPIVDDRSRAVRVDVSDRGGLDPGVSQSRAHRSCRSLREWLRQMMRVGRHSKAHNFAPNPSAASKRAIERLQHQHGRALP